MPTAISEITGLEVDTFSEAWRHECELRHILAMPSREHRLRFLYGYTDYAGKKRPGVATFRGEAAAKQLQTEAEKLFYLRKSRTAAAEPVQPQMALI